MFFTVFVLGVERNECKYSLEVTFKIQLSQCSYSSKVLYLIFNIKLL